MGKHHKILEILKKQFFKIRNYSFIYALNSYKIQIHISIFNFKKVSFYYIGSNSSSKKVNYSFAI